MREFRNASGPTNVNYVLRLQSKHVYFVTEVMLLVSFHLLHKLS